MANVFESFNVYSRGFEIEPTYHLGHSVVNCAAVTGDPDIFAKYCALFLPLVESKRKLEPENEQAVVWYGLTLHFLGRDNDARSFLRTIRDETIHTPFHLKNVSCLAAMVGENDRAMKWLERYYRADIGTLSEKLRSIRDPDLTSLHGRPEYQAMVKELEEKIATQQQLTTKR